MADNPSLNVEGTSYPILCGLCKAPIARLTESQGDGDMMGCLSCGNTANRDEVVAIVKEFATNTVQIHMNKAMAKVASRSKIMKFSGKTTDHKRYRFVVDLKL